MKLQQQLFAALLGLVVLGGGWIWRTWRPQSGGLLDVPGSLEQALSRRRVLEEARTQTAQRAAAKERVLQELLTGALSLRAAVQQIITLSEETTLRAGLAELSVPTLPLEYQVGALLLFWVREAQPPDNAALLARLEQELAELYWVD